MQLLLRDVQKVAFFRPVMTIDPNDGKDYYTRLMLSFFKLDMPVGDTYAFTMNEAREMMNAGRQADFLDAILAKYKRLEEEYDFVLCLGTDFLSQETSFEFDINADIAANLGTPVMIIINAQNKPAEQVLGTAQLTVEAYVDKGVSVLATVLNRVSPQHLDGLADRLRGCVAPHGCALAYALPEEPALGRPTMADVRNWLDARVIWGGEGLKAQVDEFLVAAMQVQHFMEYLSQGCLVITPGDRADVILSTLASRLSDGYPDAAGILLTGGIKPDESVMRALAGWPGVPIAVLLTRGHTYKTLHILHDLYGRIEPDDDNKLASALGVFEKYVNEDELRRELVAATTTKVTPRMFEYSLIQMARQDRKRIVLPEGDSERILRAADIILRRGIADVVLLGDAAHVRSRASQLGLNLEAAVVEPIERNPRFGDYVETYFELRQHKGVTEERAHDALLDRNYFGAMMVHKGDADGMVSGSISTTAATIRPAFEFIKTRPGVSVVSSVFLMCLKDRVLVYGDCAVNPDPDARQLAEIAISSAATAAVFGIEPRVAMLSYSTGTSGHGAQVDKVVEATRLAHELAPDLLLEGPIQYDAAIDPEVARTKLPDSRVAGRATVFIFPDLNTGNNTYKAVQRSAGAVAIGPVLQGLNKPVNDLSRGCTVTDIVNTVAITAIQAQVQARNPVR
jgi:phosphate acetyltransferase